MSSHARLIDIYLEVGMTFLLESVFRAKRQTNTNKEEAKHRVDKQVRITRHAVEHAQEAALEPRLSLKFVQFLEERRLMLQGLESGIFQSAPFRL